MLSPNHTFAWLVAGALALGATVAHAQGNPDDNRVFPPQDLRDMQPFAPADVELYDGAPDAHRGFFFNYDGLAWTVKTPNTSPIGFASPTGRLVFFQNDATFDVQFTEADTSRLRNEYQYGNRFEYGYMSRDHGIMGSTFELTRMHEGFEVSDVDMVINDPVIPGAPFNERRLQGLVNHVTGAPTFASQPNAGNPLPYLPASQSLRDIPVTFVWMQVENTINIWGTELLYVRRFHPFHHCGQLEMYLGARYLSFNEEFYVRGYGGALDTSYWDTEAMNNIVGPEIGGRWWCTKGRWTLEADGRFTAGYNRQNMRQQGELGEFLRPPGAVGSGLPYALGPTGFTDHVFDDQFAPIIEARTNLKYTITRNFAVRVGWDMTWIKGVVRPANIVNYTMPSFGIDPSRNNEIVWMTGVNVGIEINR